MLGASRAKLLEVYGQWFGIQACPSLHPVVSWILFLAQVPLLNVLYCVDT